MSPTVTCIRAHRQKNDPEIRKENLKGTSTWSLWLESKKNDGGQWSPCGLNLVSLGHSEYFQLYSECNIHINSNNNNNSDFWWG